MHQTADVLGVMSDDREPVRSDQPVLTSDQALAPVHPSRAAVLSGNPAATIFHLIAHDGVAGQHVNTQ